MKTIHETIVRAADVMSYACSKLKRYYNAEDSNEELELSKIFKSKNRQATGLLKRAEFDLK